MKTVIHHSADFDGLFCREIARRFLGDKDVNYIGWNFGDVPLDDALLASPIIVMDLPLDKPFGLEFKNGWIWKNGEECQPWDRWDSSNIIWIDHHASAIKSHGTDIPGYRIDGVAACRLAWQWFTWKQDNGKDSFGTSYALPTKQHYIDRVLGEPLAVRLAGEYDIWDHRGDGDLELQFGLRVQGDSLNWKALLSCEPAYTEMCISQGKVAMAYSKDADAASMHRSYLTEWEGMRLLTLNTARCNSLTFDAKDVPETGHDALLAYYFNGKCWTVSLYHAKHRTDLDLSLIAVKHGGGGHRGAAGFTCNKLPFLQ